LDVGIENWILKFADDTKVFSSVSSVEEHSKLQKGLQAINRWSEEWQMLFNFDKCKVMHIGKENQNLSYYMDGKQLEDVNQEKDLGIIITDDLKPSAHCTQNYTKANRMLGMIATRQNFLKQRSAHSTEFVQKCCQAALGVLFASLVSILQQG